MNADQKRLLKNAARELLRSADEMSSACGVWDDGMVRAWGCSDCQSGISGIKCDNHRRHDRLLSISRKLREAAS